MRVLPSRSPLGAFLGANRDAVLAALVTRMEEVRGAPVGNREQVAFLGRFLDELKSALFGDERCNAPPPPVTRNPPSESARQHGRAGYAVGKSVTDMVHDYGTVCDVVTDLARDAGLEMTLDDAQILNRWIDHGIADALSEYSSESDRASAQRLGELAHELRNALGSVTMGFRLIQTGSAAPSGRVADVVERVLDWMEF